MKGKHFFLGRVGKYWDWEKVVPGYRTPEDEKIAALKKEGDSLSTATRSKAATPSGKGTAATRT